MPFNLLQTPFNRAPKEAAVATVRHRDRLSGGGLRRESRVRGRKAKAAEASATRASRQSLLMIFMEIMNTLGSRLFWVAVKRRLRLTASLFTFLFIALATSPAFAQQADTATTADPTAADPAPQGLFDIIFAGGWIGLLIIMVLLALSLTAACAARLVAASTISWAISSPTVSKFKS